MANWSLYWWLWVLSWNLRRHREIYFIVKPKNIGALLGTTGNELPYYERVVYTILIGLTQLTALNLVVRRFIASGTYPQSWSPRWNRDRRNGYLINQATVNWNCTWFLGSWGVCINNRWCSFAVIDNIMREILCRASSTSRDVKTIGSLSPSGAACL